MVQAEGGGQTLLLVQTIGASLVSGRGGGKGQEPKSSTFCVSLPLYSAGGRGEGRSGGYLLEHRQMSFCPPAVLFATTATRPLSSHSTSPVTCSPVNFPSHFPSPVNFPSHFLRAFPRLPSQLPQSFAPQSTFPVISSAHSLVSPRKPIEKTPRVLLSPPTVTFFSRPRRSRVADGDAESRVPSSRLRTSTAVQTRHYR